MYRFKLAAAMLGLLAAGFAPSMRADELDKSTHVTINQPLQVENTVLAPGEYVFKLLLPDSSPATISIYSADGTQPRGIITGLPAYRLDPTDKALFTVSQAEGDQPAVLKSWYFPGDNFGIEFPTKKPARETGRAAKSKVTAPSTDATHD
jgi:hypothetical protein